MVDETGDRQTWLTRQVVANMADKPGGRYTPTQGIFQQTCQ
jgi:hypothetical protein